VAQFNGSHCTRLYTELDSDDERGAAPADARIDALIAAWSGLDGRARDARLESAKPLESPCPWASRPTPSAGADAGR
jgi:hypothetical protein